MSFELFILSIWSGKPCDPDDIIVFIFHDQGTISDLHYFPQFK